MSSVENRSRGFILVVLISIYFRARAAASNFFFVSPLSLSLTLAPGVSSLNAVPFIITFKLKCLCREEKNECVRVTIQFTTQLASCVCRLVMRMLRERREGDRERVAENTAAKTGTKGGIQERGEREEADSLFSLTLRVL